MKTLSDYMKMNYRMEIVEDAEVEIQKKKQLLML